ncbi:MAG: phosphoenolpyruvate--protein phosphotransferase [Brevinematales bacterium]|nr:phosphoenolpyruvate--protein phosphotransferase [Brevinematales bacterium]
MYLLRGIPISRGIAIGKTLIRYDIMKKVNLSQIKEDDKKTEITRYLNAIDQVKNEITNLVANKSGTLNQDTIQILQYYKVLLEEDFFIKNVIERIENDLYSADSALVYELEAIRKQFEKIEAEYFKSRFLDFKSIADRIIRKMNGDLELGEISEPIIIVAEEVSPAEMLHIKKELVIGIATESGSTTSHAAIIAESLEIPAVFGLRDLFNYIKKDDILIVDGYKGLVIVNPDEATVKDYKHLQKSYQKKEKEIIQVVNLPSKTVDDEGFKIYANVSNSMELNIAKRHQAEGIGLLRTELLFIANEKFLTEKEQFDIYKEYLLIFQGKDVVIRTLDMGGDKFFENSTSKDPNPFLGWRSIRVLLKEKEKFKQQLKAIIRASVFNDNIKIMIPMISSIEEVRKVKEIYKECEEEIKNEGKPFKYNISLGIMIEIPSAAILSNHLAKEVDFFSLGTNDLVQYTLAVDRNNQSVAEYYQPLNPAVLYLIHYTVVNANANNKPVSVCGEIARNPLYLRLLLGMGIRNFSVNPTYIPLVKSIIVNSSIADCKKLWNSVRNLKTAIEIERKLKDDLKKNFTEIYNSYFYDS